MSPSPDDLLLGRLALHYKLLTQEQLNQAMQAQAGRPLEEAVAALNLLPAKRLEQLLNARRDYQAKRQAPAAAPAPAPATPAPPAASPLPPMAQEAFPSLQVQELAAVIPAPAPAPVAAPPAVAPAAAPPVPAAPAASAPGTPSRLQRLLDAAARQGASDIHVHSGASLRLRLHGRLMDGGGAPVPTSLVEKLLEEMLSEDDQRQLKELGQVDLAYTVPGLGRFRVNVYRQQRGLDAVFRAIPTKPPTLAELGMPESLARFANFHQGLVLITGPAGCGKSSTLAAMIDIVNSARRDHIITVEDPIEVLHPSKLCVVNQRQVGRHTGSFARSLRAALREDPDVIALGELRDLETISLALTAAETGHLVMATLHTNNAIRTINRILGVFPPSQQDQIRTMVSESLRAIVSQRLIPRTDGKGRVPALEILVSNKAVGNLIRENKTFQIKSVLQTGASHGMCLLDVSLAELVKAGTITREQALLNADDPTRF